MNRLVTTLIVLTAASSTASASVIRHAEKDQYPRYAYKYWVNSPPTNDIKQHWEARDGDLVAGSYSLVEPDGKLRVVDYWADDSHGFNADVKRIGAAEQPAVIEPALVTSVVESDADDPPSEPKTSTPIQEERVTPLAAPANYGFGSGGKGAAPEQLYTVVESGSHRWDPKTGSYGGWVPLRPARPHAKIFSKKYVDGKLHEWAIGPISLAGRTLVFKLKH